SSFGVAAFPRRVLTDAPPALERRLIVFPTSGQDIVAGQVARAEVAWIPVNVRFWSKADICAAKTYVRFSPNSDRKSRHPRRVMSALPPRADMCIALAHVC